MSEKYRLLIVDDDDAYLDYVRAKFGVRYDIVSTNTPKNALGIARQERPRLILCDIDMPGMDGGDVSRELFADGEVRDIPVLFITALASPADLKNSGHQIGGRPAISKQAPPAELAQKIESLIRL